MSNWLRNWWFERTPEKLRRAKAARTYINMFRNQRLRAGKHGWRWFSKQHDVACEAICNGFRVYGWLYHKRLRRELRRWSIKQGELFRQYMDENTVTTEELMASIEAWQPLKPKLMDAFSARHPTKPR